MNSDNFSWPVLSQVLGKPLSSSEVGDFFYRRNVDVSSLWQPVEIGVVPSRNRTRELVDTRRIDLKEVCGVTLEFKTAHLLHGFESLGSEFVFSAITYFADGEDAAVAFEGQLPFLLSFSDTDVMVEAKVSAPTRGTGATTDQSYFFRSWNQDKYILHAIFRTATSKLRRLICYCPVK